MIDMIISKGLCIVRLAAHMATSSKSKMCKLIYDNVQTTASNFDNSTAANVTLGTKANSTYGFRARNTRKHKFECKSQTFVVHLDLNTLRMPTGACQDYANLFVDR